MNKKMVFSLPVVLAVAVCLPRPAAAAKGVTVTPTIAVCVNDDSDITCENKIVLTAPVSYGVTTTLQAQYKDTVTTKGGGETTILEDVIQFQISKTIPQFVYPFRSIDLVGSPHPTIPFQAYTIGPPQHTFTINIQTTQGTQTLSNFQLSPDAPTFLDKTSSHQVSARLVGEDVLPIAAPQLSSYILFMWNNTLDDFLLVPRTMVPTNGANVASAIGTLLQSLLNQDLALLASNPNAETAYLVKGMKAFQGTAVFDRGLRLIFQNPAVTYSTVSLEMDNAQVATVTNESAAHIVPGTARVTTFPSMSKSGTLNIQIQNTGSAQANYVVSVNQCQPNIVAPIPPQAVTMNPGDAPTLSFDIPTTKTGSVTHSCLVTLSAPGGRVYDTTQVSFSSN